MSLLPNRHDSLDLNSSHSANGAHPSPVPSQRVRAFMSERKINPRKVFDLTLPIADVAEGYKAMDERRAIKTMLHM